MGDAQRHTRGRKYLLRKAVCRLTGHMKTLKNAHNTGFLRLARPGSAGRVVSVWGEKVGRAAPALCLSLLNSPLVNRVLGHSSWSAKPGSTAKYSGIRRGALSFDPRTLVLQSGHPSWRGVGAASWANRLSTSTPRAGTPLSGPFKRKRSGRSAA